MGAAGADGRQRRLPRGLQELQRHSGSHRAAALPGAVELDARGGNAEERGSGGTPHDGCPACRGRCAGAGRPSHLRTAHPPGLGPAHYVWGLPCGFVACPVGLRPASWVCGLPFIRQQVVEAVKTGCTSPLDAVRQVCGMLSVSKYHVLLDGASCMDACGSDVKTDCTCSLPSSAQLICSESREVVKHPL